MVRYEDIKITPAEAIEIYLKRYPNTIVDEIELKLKSNSYLYEVEGYDDEKKYEIYIDPSDGTVVEIKKKLFRGRHKEISKENTAKIEEMLANALEDAGESASIYEWLLEIEDGMLEFKIRVKLKDGMEVRYIYDLASGRLIKKI